MPLLELRVAQESNNPTPKKPGHTRASTFPRAIHFTAADLMGRSSRSGAFKTVFLAFRADGARDWATNLEISPKHGGTADKIEYHHIFPKAYMKSARPDVEPRTVDDIANLAFIGATTNKQISARAPKAYIGDFDPNLLATQLVSFPDGAGSGEEFELFVQTRRTALADKINDFLELANS